MEFKFETAYDQAAVTIMARALRKTVRKKRNRRSHVFGIIVIVLALLLTLPLGNEAFILDFRTVFTWIICAVILLTLLFEDTVNAYIARKRMLPGMEKADVVFRPDSYCSETAVGKSEFKYNNIVSLAESDDYFIFVFSQSHAQIYDKKSISGGTVEEFREFITGVTGNKIEHI